MLRVAVVGFVDVVLVCLTAYELVISIIVEVPGQCVRGFGRRLRAHLLHWTIRRIATATGRYRTVSGVLSCAEHCFRAPRTLHQPPTLPHCLGLQVSEAIMRQCGDDAQEKTCRKLNRQQVDERTS